RTEREHRGNGGCRGRAAAGRAAPHRRRAGPQDLTATSSGCRFCVVRAGLGATLIGRAVLPAGLADRAGLAALRAGLARDVAWDAALAGDLGLARALGSGLAAGLARDRSARSAARSAARSIRFWCAAWTSAMTCSASSWLSRLRRSA